VLAHAGAVQTGFAVLRAGRDQLYIGQVQGGVCGREWLGSANTLGAGLEDVVFAEPALEVSLQALALRARYVPVHAGDALVPVLQLLARGGSDLALVDANYVRDEEAIYAQPHAG
jgi:hypothetical protein